jgi:hypothetical protein
MLISDTAEMGKYTVLTLLSKEIEENFPDKWVVRTDLNEHTDTPKEKLAEVVSWKQQKLESCVEMAIFNERC